MELRWERLAAELLDPRERFAPVLVETEERLRDDAELQAVMFMARSLDNVRSTHPHYFDEGAGPGGHIAEFLIPRG
jgi:hypothetical protein